MGKKIIWFAIVAIVSINAEGQINATVNNNALQLAQIIAGPGVTVSNAICTGPIGSAGIFSGHSSLGLDSGIVLTNGYVSNIPGPNNQVGATGAWGVTGTDAQFAGYLGVPQSDMFDECDLEFDFQSDGDSVSFKYVFGSEEYPEYVCSQFNDAFAFFISGPGINGLDNIALIPGTTLPVAINSVNSGVPGVDAGGQICNLSNQSLAYSQYYVNNGTGNEAPYNSNPYYIQYNGFTTPLLASINGLLAHQTYHAKLVIADLIDATFDSGIFIEAGSLISNTSSCKVALGLPRTTTDSLSAIIVVGCSEGIIPFQLLHPDTSSMIVHFTVGGTALSGVDYVPFADSVVFNAGDTIENLLIQPIGHEQNSIKTIIIQLSTTCYFADTIYLMDTLAFQVTPHDTTVCAEAAVALQAVGGANYLWAPSTGLSENNIANPVATPDTAITYLCSTTVGGCTLTDTVRLTTTQTPPFTLSVIPRDTTVCPGSFVLLDAIGGGNSFIWLPGIYLTNNTISDPFATVYASTTYICTSSSGVCSLSDTVTVNIFPSDSPVITLHGDTLQSSPGLLYQWYYNGQEIAGATDSFIIAAQAGDYQVQFTGANACGSFSAQFHYTVTGISTVNNFSPPRLYPNPNNGNFVIEFADNDVKQVSITDLLGQQILPSTKVIQKQEFDLSQFSNGVYILKIEGVQNAGPSVYKQVVIQK